jgi:hypothetical protein
MPQAAHSPSEHSAHVRGSLWSLLALGATGAVIAAPYALPLLGIGDAETSENIINIMHNHDGTGGSGLAGIINSGIALIPSIGATLAAGGWASIAATGLIGVGGALLAKWMEKREAPEDFKWSKVIRYASLATSMLIALPAILTGISIGLTFLATLLPISTAAINATIGALYETLGSASTTISPSSGSGLLAIALPHLLSCGASIVPLALAVFMGKKTPEKTIDATHAERITMHKPLQPAAASL